MKISFCTLITFVLVASIHAQNTLSHKIQPQRSNKNSTVTILDIKAVQQTTDEKVFQDNGGYFKLENWPNGEIHFKYYVELIFVPVVTYSDNLDTGERIPSTFYKPGLQKHGKAFEFDESGSLIAQFKYIHDKSGRRRSNR